ncbi:MAG: VWA domain-containing protein [Gemmatimonadetes bacterium]|nr:VWA domain-containing protein [Gemmatimonadota bacterium]
MDTIFEFLFKYRLLLFQEGDFTFASPWPVLLVLGGVAVVTLPALLTYRAARGASSRWDRGVMAALRLGLVAILVFILFRPTLILTSVVPQRNFVGILIDDSQSMRITDQDGVARSDFVQATFGSEGSELLTALEEKFTLRFFRFSRDASRLNDMADLSYSGTATNLGNAMVRAQEELAGVPISGLVVFSDGADNSGEVLAESLLPLQAAGIPVYTVGLGEEELTPDVQISRVEMPRTVLAGTSLVVDVIVSHRGYSGRTVQLVVEDTGLLLASEDVTFERDGEPVVVRVRIQAQDAGPRLLRFRVSIQPGERVTENNVRDVLVNVVSDAEKILYFEGEPRWEVKFLRRAVSEDENLQVVLLQRTAEGKFLRLDVDNAEELAAGFPKTREELFRYRALILGSVEASFFTHDQLDMIADFVSRRGGGLLFLGGRNAFAEGGYQGTRLAEVLPVFLDDELSSGVGPYFDELFITPTRAGLTHPATQLGADNSEAVVERWEALPSVTTLNPITRLKPGATSLLTGGTEEDRERQVVLAFHRYGRGKVVVLPIQDSWIWQMHADIPLEDQTHETFWRQLLRWLTDGVPEQVGAQTERELVEPGQPVNILVEVGDSAYAAVNNANVVAVVRDPSGDSMTITLEWDVEQDGQYGGRFLTTSPGLYEVSILASRGGDTIGTAVTYVEAAPSADEYFDASMRGTTLRRIADQTGGLFYTPENVATLAEDISFTGAGVTLTEERDLWDMPILLFLVLGLMAGEWGYRRKRSLI